MENVTADIVAELMLDGNSVGGLLFDTFGKEMTAAPAECASCGRQGDVATLLVFGREMGSILRCPGCGSIVMRLVETPKAIYVDTRGAAFLSLAHPPQRHAQL